MKFALSHTPEARTEITKTTKVFKHLECDTDLIPLDEGKWACPTCRRSGYPVKRKKITHESDDG